MQRILKILEDLKIDYKKFSHKPTFTCDEARDVEIPGKRVKTLILTNKNKTNFYMVVLEDKKKLDVKILQKYFDEKKISFAKNEKILELIGIEVGHISPFALINNKQKNIKIIFDKSLENKEVGFHPLKNDTTFVLNLDFMDKFLEFLDFKIIYLDL